MCSGALLHIHRELDESGYVFGLGPLRVLRRIIVPLLLPTLMYAWLWIALLTYRELTPAVFLQSRDSVTLSTYVFRALRGGNIPRGAALVLLAVMTPLVAVYFVWGRRRLDIGQ